ncbi:pre-mRNA-splicing ATP-dependent RNA helicase Prp28p [[Candida] anglica]|uniref:RNA helicase n=1 Tax=[Candida] anglica TaxID=148631 RepID=A0ABP0ELW5_9ASCO
MSKRPVSVEELLRLKNEESISQPRFLSKKERKRLAKEKLAKEEQEKLNKANINPPSNTIKRPIEEIDDFHLNSKRSKHPASFNNTSSQGPKKFNFEWKAEDDTSSDYQPLISYDIGTIDSIEIDDKHWSAKPLEQMTLRDWRIFREDYSITSKGGNIANPLRSWDESKIPSNIIKILTNELKYDEPTPIQRAAIPIALSERDVVGVAETGSGKTIAFLLPLLSYLTKIDSNYIKYEHTQEINRNKTLGLILAPTRELALQISKEAEKFGKQLGFNIVTIIGGHQYEESIHAIQDGVHIVVATPGRLVDSLERGIVNLSKCYYLIMDEADKMIDMGFEKPLQSIMSYLPASEDLINSNDSLIFKVKKRITLMFTATISPTIEKITKNYLIQPGYLFIGTVGEAIDNIDQHFEYLGSNSSESLDELDPIRQNKLITTLKQHSKSFNSEFSIIIFANYKKTCESLSNFLSSQGFSKNSVIHGSKSQEFRERAIKDFRNGTSNVLIATDIAARGIDVPNVSLVVNYQMSKKFDEYIHRIGRTGRAGNYGISYTILDDNDSEVFPDLKRFLSKGGKKCPDWLLRHESTRVQFLKD